MVVLAAGGENILSGGNERYPDEGNGGVENRENAASAGSTRTCSVPLRHNGEGGIRTAHSHSTLTQHSHTSKTIAVLGRGG